MAGPRGPNPRCARKPSIQAIETNTILDTAERERSKSLNVAAETCRCGAKAHRMAQTTGRPSRRVGWCSSCGAPPDVSLVNSPARMDNLYRRVAHDQELHGKEVA